MSLTLNFSYKKQEFTRDELDRLRREDFTYIVSIGFNTDDKPELDMPLYLFPVKSITEANIIRTQYTAKGAIRVYDMIQDEETVYEMAAGVSGIKFLI